MAGLAVFAEIETLLGAGAAIRRKGSLIVHPDERTWAAEPERLARLRAAGVTAELLGPTEVRALEPRLTGPLHGASRFPGDLQCDPRAIARGLDRSRAAQRLSSCAPALGRSPSPSTAAARSGS